MRSRWTGTRRRRRMFTIQCMFFGPIRTLTGETFFRWIFFFATLIHLLMIEQTELGPMCEANPELRKLLFDLVLHYLQTIRDKAFQRVFWKYRTSQRSYGNEGNALTCFPLISMLNHSCAPNVFNLPLRDHRSAIVVLHPVRNGEQLFLCFRNDHTMQSRNERQKELWKTLGFECRCKACLHDYPTLTELGDDPETDLQESRMLLAILKQDTTKLFELVSEMRCYLNDHDQKYPTSRLCLTQIHYMLCLIRLYGFTSDRCTVDMYCSEECLSKAYREYHRYECPIIRDLRRITTPYAWTALRTVAKAIASFDHDLEAIKEHLDGLDTSKVNAFTMDWNTATSKDVYNTMHVLWTNQNLDRRAILSLDIFFCHLNTSAYDRAN
uniref:SET domain-containing protein n=1 Tax=Anopheles dirus TaxID=7168 RepID=A0A182MX98_9DIPT